MNYTLLNGGDSFEKHYALAFLNLYFPEYEKYWAKNIVPLTNRPKNIHFKNSSILLKEGFTPENICSAQLHYTIFRHIARSYDIINALESKSIQNICDSDILAEGLFHVCAAQDVAFEFLQRNKNPNIYDPWAAKKSMSKSNTPGSKEARDDWQKNNNFPLKKIRNYRNHIAHGRILPGVFNPPKMHVPKIGMESSYLDWRLITDGYNNSISNDFDSLDNVLKNAWEDTLNYFKNEWLKL